MLANKYILDGKVYLVLFPLKYSLDKKPARINKFLNVISNFESTEIKLDKNSFIKVRNEIFRLITS